MQPTQWPVILAVSLITLFTACSGDNSGSGPEVTYPDATISAIADMRFLAPDLLTEGEPLNLYLGQHYRMLAQSAPIAQAGLQQAATSEAGYIFVAGNLTANGSRISHQQIAAMFADAEKAGKQVFVAPGPRDINSPEAVRFTASGYEPAEAISADDFASMYADFGYKQALAKDPQSLSYVASLKKGLRVMAIDACLYRQNTRDSLVEAAAVSDATMGWIMQQLQKAKSEDARVIGLMSHNLVPHYIGHEQNRPLQLPGKWNKLTDSLVAGGMDFIVTGGSGAIDVVSKPSGASAMLDVQAGSPLIYPSTVRLLETAHQDQLHVSDITIKQIAYDTGGLAFQQYARQYLTESLNRIIPYQLENYGITGADAKKLKPLLVGGMKAFLAGEEKQAWQQLPDSSRTAIEQMFYGSNTAKAEVGGLIYGLYHDTSPSDRDVTLNLNTGNMQQ